MIGGLIVAAVLTLIFLPALYVLCFCVPPEAKGRREQVGEKEASLEDEAAVTTG
ncbi:efflux RND transporter permease subunit [Rhizobium sp. ARZ01]|uniref:efflux RND transporter permease subunit n=1 Tax=Rhizobium sp. ARZ01 TaxID=2769313 RepID=UPI001FEE012C|nr:efflux RND transporter permease subunit [Rhizobium sp. ARZ01]